jgi:hypothetical protein
MKRRDDIVNTAPSRRTVHREAQAIRKEAAAQQKAARERAKRLFDPSVKIVETGKGRFFVSKPKQA